MRGKRKKRAEGLSPTRTHLNGCLTGLEGGLLPLKRGLLKGGLLRKKNRKVLGDEEKKVLAGRLLEETN